MYYVRVTD